MASHACLFVGDHHISLTLCHPTARQHIPLAGRVDDGDWYDDPAGCARVAADRVLAAAGYRRASGWGYDPASDTLTASLAVTERTPA